MPREDLPVFRTARAVAGTDSARQRSVPPPSAIALVRERLLRVITIGSGQLNGERNSPCVADQMTFAAQLGPVSRVRSCLPPPKTARIELPSTTARDQSICP